MSTLAPKLRNTARSPLTLIGGLLILVIVAMLIFRPPTLMRGLSGDPQNPEPQGTMALAEVLTDRGVDLKVLRSVSSAIAAEADLLILSHPEVLTPEQTQALAEMGVDTVLIGATRRVPGFTGALTRAETPAGVISPGCEDPRAAAGPIRTSGPFFTDPDAAVCFPGGDSGAVLTWDSQAGSRVTLLPKDFLTNAYITEEANAALALRVLGEAETATWLVGSASDPYSADGSHEDFSPDWLLAAIGVVFLAMIWWRGPRFGPLTAEPLPVIVNAAETTMGRGWLYRRAKDLDHGATSLRLGALNRIGPRIGLASSASQSEVIAKVAQATGRDHRDVATLLYGPAPTSADSLQALALSLDVLVNEVEHS